MVQLHETRVLARIAPDQIRARAGVGGGVGAGVGPLARVEGVEQLAPRRRQAEAHVGEFVVDEAGVEAGDQSAGHGGGEDEAGEGEDGQAERDEAPGVQGLLEVMERSWVGGEVREQRVRAEDGEPVP